MRNAGHVLYQRLWLQTKHILLCPHHGTLVQVLIRLVNQCTRHMAATSSTGAVARLLLKNQVLGTDMLEA